MKILSFLIILLTISYVLAQEDDHDHQEEEEQEKLTSSQIWGFGFLAGLGISLIGFIAAIIVIVFKKCCSMTFFQVLIKFLFALACGALLGDAIVHILAEAFSSTQTNNAIVAVICLCSIVLFLIIERIFGFCGISHSHWHQTRKVENQDKNLPTEGNLANEKDTKNFVAKSQQNMKEKSPSDEEANKDQIQEQNKGNCCKSLLGKGSAGYLNLIGSLIHNFIDGLALGVAFSTGHTQDFVPVLIAIIAHEIPREIGDVAILLENKFSTTQTILCNGMINLISIVGVLIGLGINSLDDATKAYILVFVAGNFIYIAADIWRNLFKNKTGWWKNIIEFLGLALGIGVMFLLLLLEEGQDHNH